MGDAFSVPSWFCSLLTLFSQTESEWFWILLPKKIEANCKKTFFFCSGIINLLFDGLAYYTSRHFAHCSYFSSPLGARKNTTQLAKYPPVLYAKPSNKVYIYHIWIGFKILSEYLRSTSGERNLNSTPEEPEQEHLAERNSNFGSLETFWKRGNVNTS